MPQALCPGFGKPGRGFVGAKPPISPQIHLIDPEWTQSRSSPEGGYPDPLRLQPTLAVDGRYRAHRAHRPCPPLSPRTSAPFGFPGGSRSHVASNSKRNPDPTHRRLTGSSHYRPASRVDIRRALSSFDMARTRPAAPGHQSSRQYMKYGDRIDDIPDPKPRPPH